jgi:adenylylsulfate kinase
MTPKQGRLGFPPLLRFSTIVAPMGGTRTLKFHSVQSDSESRTMAEQKATNITWHDHKVSKAERSKLNGHKGAVLWFTGLSACGKSTVANTVDHLLHSRGKHTFVLDGDNIRHGLNKNLGFSAADRAENIRRIGEVAKLFCEAGTIALTAFISPYRADRDAVRALLAQGEFIEIYVKASIETCEKRDPKGLYKKARAGELKNFTGIDDPYEAPEKAEIILDADTKGIDDLAHEVVSYLEKQHVLAL